MMHQLKQPVVSVRIIDYKSHHLPKDELALEAEVGQDGRTPFPRKA